MIVNHNSSDSPHSNLLYWFYSEAHVSTKQSVQTMEVVEEVHNK